MNMLRTLPPARVAKILAESNTSAEPALEHRPQPFARELKRAIMKEVLSMGLPSMAGFIVTSINELVNMFWLARLGTAPVAAITMAATLVWSLSFANMVVGVGSVATISRRWGEGDRERTEMSIKATFLLKFAFGMAFGLIGLLIMNWALGFLGAAADVHGMATKYLTVQFATLGFLMTSFSVYTALRSLGRPRAAFMMQVMATLINLVLDPLLIYGIGPFPRLEILGASIATAISYTSVVIVGCLLLSGSRSPLRIRWFARPLPVMADLWPVLRVGLPAGINQTSFSLSMNFAVKLVAIYGTDMVAIYGAGQKILHFGIMAIVGLGLGTGSLIGQFLGSRSLDKAWLSGVLAVRLSAYLTLAYGLLMFVGADYIVAFFLRDESLHALAAQILRIMAVSLPLVGIHVGAETAFEGAGQNTPPMVLSIVHAWLLVIPLMYLLGPVLEFGPHGLMWGWTVAHAIGGAAALWLFRRGTWLKHEI